MRNTTGCIGQGTELAASRPRLLSSRAVSGDSIIRIYSRPYQTGKGVDRHLPVEPHKLIEDAYPTEIMGRHWVQPIQEAGKGDH